MLQRRPFGDGGPRWQRLTDYNGITLMLLESVVDNLARLVFVFRPVCNAVFWSPTCTSSSFESLSNQKDTILSAQYLLLAYHKLLKHEIPVLDYDVMKDKISENLVFPWMCYAHLRLFIHVPPGSCAVFFKNLISKTRNMFNHKFTNQIRNDTGLQVGAGVHSDRTANQFTYLRLFQLQLNRQLIVGSTSRSYDSSNNLTDRVQDYYIRIGFLNFLLENAPTTGSIEDARAAFRLAVRWITERASSAGALHMLLNTIRDSGIFNREATALYVEVRLAEGDNSGNTTVQRSCSASDVEETDSFLVERLDRSVFFGVLAGRVDVLALPPPGTDIGGHRFDPRSFVERTFAGMRERTKTRDLKNNTGHVKSVKFKGYHLLVVGKNEELNLVAVQFARKESMVAFLPPEHVRFVKGTKAFVALGNDPSSPTFSTDLCEYLSLNHLQGRSVDDIIFHHGFARGVADRSVPTKRPNGEKGFSVGEISAFLHGITEFGMPRRGGSVTDIVRHYLTSRTTHGINTHVPKKYDHYAPIISLWGVTDIGDREPKWEDFDVAVHSLRFPYTP